MKKAFSLFLAFIMVLSVMPLSVHAEETTEAAVENDISQDISYGGTNALGDIVSDAINDSESENADDEKNYHIEAVEIDGLTATAEIYAPDNAILVVSVYDENTGAMATSGKTVVNSDNQIVTVRLAECDMPEYFTVKAFLLDAENTPLCPNFESIEYTKSFQEFLSQTVEDFEEEKVINLDYGYETNFAVVNDEAVVIEITENENIVVTDDYENGIYIIENANEQITSLEAGDVFYYIYGDGEEDYILTKIAEITNDNGTVTIIADAEAEIDELFSYIKIDTDEYVPALETYGMMSRAINTGANLSSKFNVSVESDLSDAFSVKFKGSVKFDFSVKFYFSIKWFKTYYEVSNKTNVTVDGELELSVNGKEKSKPLKLIDKSIPICFGLSATVNLQVLLKAENSVTANASLRMEFVNGAKYVSDKSKTDLSKTPVIEFVFNSVSGSVEISMTPSFSIGISIVKIVKASIGVEAKFLLAGKFLAVEHDEFTGDMIHDCEQCIDGELTLTYSADIKIDFGLTSKKKTVLKINLFSAQVHLFDFYISLINGENFIEFGIGDCPNVRYKTVFTVTDEYGDPLYGAKISDGKGIYEFTNSYGKAEVFLSDGDYSVSAALKGYESASENYDFSVSGCKKQVDIILYEHINTSGIFAEGDFWTLYNDGEMVIRGDVSEISGSFFHHEYSEKIKSVFVRYGVKNIGYDAFWGLSALESVSLPGSVMRIKSNAFYNCSSLKNISLPDSIISIEGDAFYGCTALESIEIPEKIRSIENSTFENCSSLKNVILPEWLEYIGDRAFAYCSSIESVDIPKAVQQISSSAFAYCYSLNSINVSEENSSEYCDIDGVLYTYSESEAMDITYDLHIYPAGKSEKTYSVPDGTTRIEAYSFAGCRGFTEIIIPDSATQIGAFAFSDCDGLAEIIIPDSVTQIDTNAFSDCDGFTEIIIPDNIKVIGERAFAGCDGLTEIILPDSMTEIAPYAFSDCDGLTEIIIPDSITKIGEHAFYDCDGLTEITVPGSVKSIGNGAFYSCSALESLTVLDGVEKIDGTAFYECSLLDNISLPDSVKYIGSSAFSQTAYLMNEENRTDGNIYINNHLIDVATNVDELIIKEGTVSVASEAARDSYSLTSVTIPESVLYINEYAFRNCSRLTDIKIHDGVIGIGREAFSDIGYTYDEGVLYVGNYLIDVNMEILSCEIKSGTLNIADNAFDDCHNLTAVIIPDSVRVIGDYAFSDCYYLETANIPDSVKIIGEGAFQYCHRLNEINIPDGITSIGDFTFGDCSNILSISIPDSVISIGENAFSGCVSASTITVGKDVRTIGNDAFPISQNLEEIIWNAENVCDFTAETTPFYGDYSFGSEENSGVSVVFSDSVEKIPAYLLYGMYGVTKIHIGKNVKSIGDYAFADCYNLSELFMGEKVEKIGDYAFSSCSELAEIIIPDSVTEIGEYAFSYCNGIGDVELPDSLLSIGSFAFSASDIANVKICENVSYIGDGAFSECQQLESIDVDENNNFYSSDDAGALFNKERTVILQFPAASAVVEYSVPETVTEIASMAFYLCYSLKHINLPSEITKIGYGAFVGCMGLESINIPSGVTEIEYAAFAYCSGLEYVTVQTGINKIGNGAFLECLNLKEVIIPDSVTEIGMAAFGLCSSLKSIHISENVEKIGSLAFASCSSLEKITVDERNKYFLVDSYGVLFNKDKTELICYPAASDLVKYVVPSSVKKIGDYAFWSASALENITISKGVEYIGYGALAECSKLEEIVIPSTVWCINESAFQNCTGLTEIKIGSGVRIIATYAFDGCSELTSITIPENVEKIGWGAFNNCSKLTEVNWNAANARIDSSTWHFDNNIKFNFGDSVKTIPDYMFWDCNWLTEIDIPDSVERIGDYAFYNCTGLTSITIPENVREIGMDAFYGCSNLTEVNWNAVDASLDYSWASVWQSDYVEFNFGESVKTIPDNMFTNCNWLTEIDIPDSIERIGSLAFSDCDGLINITIPGSVKYIGNDAFSSCDNLQEVTIEGDVNSIGSDAFYSCDGLLSVTIFGNVRSIGSYAFYDCNNLQEVTIEGVVNSIGNSAFSRCDNLREITIGCVNNIGFDAFYDCDALETVYYMGTQEQWNDITFEWGNDAFINAEIVFIEEPSQTAYVMRSNNNIIPSMPVQSDSITIENAVVGNEYLIIVVKDEFSNDLLSSDNLLFIDQKKAESETLTFEFGDSFPEAKVLYYTTALACKHNFVAGDVIAPTCTEEGYTVFTCSECHKIFNAGWVVENGHSYNTETTEATCTEQGYATYTCSVCQDSYVGDYVNAKGHNYEAAVTEATCTEQGYTTYTCSVCNDSYVGDYVNEKGHDYEAAVTKATCTEQGYTTYTCSGCNDSYVDDYVKENGHSGGTATCTKKAVCEVCHVEYGTINADNHAGGTVNKNAVTATCTSGGYSGDTYCKDCDKKLSSGVALSAKSHSYNSIVTAPTCTESGFTTFTCTVCSDTYKGNTLSATGHSWGVWTVTVSPTTLKEGTETRKCGTCKTTESRSIAKLPVEKITVNETDLIKLSKTGENNVFSTAGVTVEELLKNVTAGVKIVNASDKTVTTGKLASGMKIILNNKNGSVADTLTVIIFGDANGDSTVSASDARTVLRASVGLEQLTVWQESAANADMENSKITAADARQILRASVGLENLSDLLKKIK